MLARDLAQPYPFVTTDVPAIDAARILADQGLPALLVLDSNGQPYAIVPGSQMVRQLVPDYLLNDPLLAATADDQQHADIMERLEGFHIAEWAPRHLYPPHFVGPDARPMEIATLMARTHSPLVAVIERDGSRVHLLGTITAARLMQHFIQST